MLLLIWAFSQIDNKQTLATLKSWHCRNYRCFIVLWLHSVQSRITVDRIAAMITTVVTEIQCIYKQSHCGNWDWIKNILSLVPKADIKIVQLDLLGAAMVFFSFISYFQICFSFNFHWPIGQHAYIGFLAWLEHFVWVLSHQDPSVSPHGATG